MLHRLAVAVICSNVLLSAGEVLCERCDGQTQLQWKFEKGQSLFYRFSRSQSMTVTLPNGQTDKSLRKAGYELEVICNTLRSDGAADIEVFARRLTIDIEQPNGKISYDSNSDAAAADASEMLLFPLFDLYTKHSFTARIAPNAKVTRVKVSKELTKAVEENPMATAFAEEFTSTKAKKAMLQKIFVELPKKAIKKGEKLIQTESQISPVGTVTTTSVEYAYQGPQKNDAGNMHGFEIKIFTESDDPKLQISGESSEGTMLFDRDNSRLESLDAKYKHTLLGKRNEDDPGLKIETEDLFQVERMAGPNKK